MPETTNSGDRIVLSNGVVFKVKDFPREAVARIYQKIQDQYPEPKVPMVWIKDMGRDEPNPNDPDYRAAITTWQVRFTDRVVNALAFDALELEQPGEVAGPESAEFRDFLKLVYGEEPMETERGRYVQWVQYRAIPPSDLMMFSRRLLQLAGIPEEAVREIEATFPSDTGGKPDTERDDIGSGQNGD